MTTRWAGEGLTWVNGMTDDELGAIKARSFGHPDIDALVDEVLRLRGLSNKLLDAYEDACYQGSGVEPLSSPTWHMFLSTWEEADWLIPKARKALNRD